MKGIMAVYGYWAHGNTLAVESPDMMTSIKHFAWGTELQFKGHQSSWLHASIPTPMTIEGKRSKLARVYILFNIVDRNGFIQAVHIYDGPNKIWQSPVLRIEGSHMFLDPSNTFNLPSFHDVNGAIGISFLFQSGGPIDIDTPGGGGHLHVAHFGADFDVF